MDSVGDAMVVAPIFSVLNWCIGLAFYVRLGLSALGLGFLLAFLSRWLVDAILCAMFMSALGTFAQGFVLGGRAHHV